MALEGNAGTATPSSIISGHYPAVLAGCVPVTILKNLITMPSLSDCS
jgi:hypothetical protein